MKKLSLDTSFIIDFLDEKEETAKFLEIYDYDRLVIPSIVLVEAKWLGDSLEKFEEIEPVKFGKGEVEKTLELKQFLESRGEMINRLDLMIASQTMESGSVLVTGDSDFDSLEEHPEFEHINYEDYVENHE